MRLSHYSWLLVWFFCSLCCLKGCLVIGGSCNGNDECGSVLKYQVCDSEHKCVDCISDSNCTLSANDHCISSTGYCQMDTLWQDFDWRKTLCAITILLGAAIAAGGGLGGGGVFVPVFILIGGIEAKVASGLSLATIFGGSLVNLAMNFAQNHPNRAHRTLPDLSTILILEPMLLAGTSIGVLLNVIFPEPLLLILLVLVLGYASYRTSKKAVQMWKKENDNIFKQQQRQEEVRDISLSSRKPSNDFRNPLLGNMSNPDQPGAFSPLFSPTEASTPFSLDMEKNTPRAGNDSLGSISKNMESSQAEQEIEELSKRCGTNTQALYPLSPIQRARLSTLVMEETHILRPMLLVLVIWFVSSYFSMSKSGLFYHVDSCSPSWWAYTVMEFPVLGLITAAITWISVKKYTEKRSLHWVPDPGDIQWNLRKAVIYPLAAMAAGQLGGLLGIGGGMVLSPLLLELGVSPRVTSATSAIAVAVTSSSGTLQKVLLDMLSWDYMLYYMIIGATGTFIGQTLFNYIIKRYGRESVVVFSVQAMMLLAIILMGVKGILEMVQGNSSMSFQPPC